jgi:hypothetical protein
VGSSRALGRGKRGRERARGKRFEGIVATAAHAVGVVGGVGGDEGRVGG